MLWTIALLVILVVFLFYVNRNCSEHMQNKVERAKMIHEKTKPVFHGGDHSYEKFRKEVPDTDSVEYMDVRNL